jgi:hypothetical protein
LEFIQFSSLPLGMSTSMLGITARAKLKAVGGQAGRPAGINAPVTFDNHKRNRTKGNHPNMSCRCGQVLNAALAIPAEMLAKVVSGLGAC